MTIRERIQAANRLQHGRAFKIAASIAIIAITIVALSVFLVRVTSPTAVPEGITLPQGAAPELAEAQQRELDLITATLSGGGSTAGIIVAGLAFAGVALVVVWLGLGVTYLTLAAVGGAVITPLYFYHPTVGVAKLLAGIVLLTMSFTALLQLLRLVFSLPSAVFAIARNVLAEAVRLKLSLIFIVLLVFGLAALPLLLDPAQPLRYRVQAFLQYASGTSFWTIAVLVLFFSVATVAFEQRDKVIWQTMTKPVAAWQYILGKWVGVVGLAGVLLFVSSSGVFLFTEYLRNQPALGERAPYEPKSSDVAVTEDRLVLETQVLTARKIVGPTSPIALFDIDLDAIAKQRVEEERVQKGQDWQPTLDELMRFRKEIAEQATLSYMSIDPTKEQFEEFEFRGLQRAKGSKRPMTLRYKINAGGNRPDEFYDLSFMLPDGSRIVRNTGLGFSHTLTISPDAISDDGTLYLRVYNGRLVDTNSGALGFYPNPDTVTFPADGLEISYAVGSYRVNFIRVMLVLWVKLGFLAAIGVWSATFLSFPVASLVSIGTFFIAESSTYVASSLQSFGPENIDGKWRLWRYLVHHIADTVSRTFIIYADLKPTSRLSTGMLLGWGDVARGTIVLAVLALILYAMGVVIFRRRELAIYSGH